MPDESTTPTMPPVATPASDAPAEPSAPATDEPVSDTPQDGPNEPTPSPTIVAPTTDIPPADDAPVDESVLSEVAHKIVDSHNVLIALSSDPSVDELAAAIGLSIYLDKLGKRATAIYSGSTPNALEFLKPEETFESTADTLQDFVIALSKDKADHLRYKLDGDYVKIYITPYRTRISEDDLDFSYGDFNVDLVLALDVANGSDLDSALREHGRIMHDASVVNVTTGNPGKFAEIEWSDKTASSVSEMIARLLYDLNAKIKIGPEEATAFLTGIVAATDRFSNSVTTPETMKLASELMESGANQQLISKNITADIENEIFSVNMSSSGQNGEENANLASLDIKHGDETIDEELPDESSSDEGPSDEKPAADDAPAEKGSGLLDDLKAAEATLSQTGAEATPDLSNRPVRLDEAKEQPASEPTTELASESSTEELTTPSESPLAPTPAPTPSLPETDESNSDKPEKVLAPTADFDSEISDESTVKYGKMLEDALSGVGGAGATAQPATPIISNPADELMPTDDFAAPASVDFTNTASNPAAMSAPTVSTNPEINGVPSINYMPMPGEEVLPPPPTPPIDMSAPSDTSLPGNQTTPNASLPPVGPTAPAESVDSFSSPSPTPATTPPSAEDPSAFRIPGM